MTGCGSCREVVDHPASDIGHRIVALRRRCPDDPRHTLNWPRGVTWGYELDTGVILGVSHVFRLLPPVE